MIAKDFSARRVNFYDLAEGMPDRFVTSQPIRDFAAKFDDLAHVLMPENIPALHGGLIAIK